jgi:hypothetical protein
MRRYPLKVVVAAERAQDELRAAHFAERERTYAEYPMHIAALIERDPQRLAELAAARVERQAWRKRLRAEDRQRARDEKHEAKAAAVACLIEAFIELRPYVGTEGVEP